MRKILNYINDIKFELSQIEYISKKNLKSGVIGVILMIIILGIVFSLVDVILKSIVLLIIGV